MPPQIQFQSLPPNIRIPGIYTEFDNSQANFNQINQRALLIGQTVTAQPAVLTQIASASQAAALFGASSMLALMVAAYRAADPFGELWVLPLADAGGAVAASDTITVTGSPSANGVISLYIAGKLVPVAVTAGQANTAVATAIQAAIAAYTDPATGLQLPVSASVLTNVVTLTAVNKGTPGNSIDVRLNYFGARNNEQTPAGLTIAITAMSAGATDPDLSGLDPILGDNQFDFIGLGGYTGATQLNSIDTLMSNATGRWSWQRKDYGHVWTAKMDADATGSTNSTFGKTRNGPHVTCVTYEPSPSPPWQVAATWTAAAAVSLKVDPARPLQTLSLPGLLAPPIGSRYTQSTRQTLLTSGLATMRYNPDMTCTIERCVTTYQTNALGLPDQSYLDAETMFTLMAVTRKWTNALAQKFPRAKIAVDGTPVGPGSNIITPKSARAELVAQYREMMDLGWVQDIQDFSAGIVAQINASDPTRLDVLVDPYLINGLRVIAMMDQFRLTVPQR